MQEDNGKNQAYQPDAQNQPGQSYQSAQPTPAPIITPEAIIPPYQPKTNPKIVAVIAGGIVALVLIISLSIFLSALNKQAETTKNNEPAVENTEKTEVVLTETQKQALVKNVLNELRKVEQLVSNNDVITTQDIYDTNSPYYLATGVKSAMPLERSFGLTISVENNQQLLNTLAEHISSKLVDDMNFEKYDYGWLNSEKNLICGPVSVSNNSLTITCGHTSWLSTEKIALGNALAEAYKESEGEYPTFLDADPDTIKNSPYRPYQKVFAVVGNELGLFYRPSDKGSWVYFTSTDGTLSCSDYYADSGAQHAFQGETCLDAEGQTSTVKESTASEK
ncbi:hypothetical protein IKF94_01375 [Candidatus Saccharibacteria bacterium]|nr:hypothetical protein [Candidatus Saccharibacteria bacterium]